MKIQNSILIKNNSLIYYNKDVNKNNKFYIREIKNKNSNKNEQSLSNNVDSILELLNNLDDSLFSKNHIDEIKNIINDIFSDNTLLSNKDRFEVLETKLKYYINNNMNDEEKERFLKLFDEIMSKVIVSFDEFYNGKYYSSELLFEILNITRDYREKFNNN